MRTSGLLAFRVSSSVSESSLLGRARQRTFRGLSIPNEDKVGSSGSRAEFECKVLEPVWGQYT